MSFKQLMDFVQTLIMIMRSIQHFLTHRAIDWHRNTWIMMKFFFFSFGTRNTIPHGDESTQTPTSAVLEKADPKLRKPTHPPLSRKVRGSIPKLLSNLPVIQLES